MSNPVETIDVTFQNQLTVGDIQTFIANYSLPNEVALEVKSSGSFDQARRLGYNASTNRLTIQPAS